MASLSLGAERRFEIAAKQSGGGPSDHRLELLLPHGSLLVMWPPTQPRCLHRLPKEADGRVEERINLTFRTPSG